MSSSEHESFGGEAEPSKEAKHIKPIETVLVKSSADKCSVWRARARRIKELVGKC